MFRNNLKNKNKNFINKVTKKWLKASINIQVEN